MDVKERNFLIDELLKIFGDYLKSIVIFGSYARKNYTKNSDVDIIIIVEKDENKSLLELRRKYLMRFEKSLDLQIFLKKEAISNFNNFSPLFSTLLLGNIILFDRGGFFEGLVEEFTKKMLTQNIKYCEGGKIWDLKKVAV